jgi:hypothetical protein
MSERDENAGKYTHQASSGKTSLVLRVTDSDFQREVLERLGRLEAKMDMLAGSTQPGRMKLAEDRINLLEKTDIQRGVMTGY